MQDLHDFDSKCLCCIEGEERRNKIKVEIKPITPNGAAAATADNLDDIRNVVLGLRLSPTAAVRCVSQATLNYVDLS